MSFENKIPTVKSCCCGCTLRVGTLILLWIGVVSSSLGLLGTLVVSAQASFFSTLIHIVVKGIIGGIYAMGIYGIEKERPSYLRPYLGLQVFYMAFLIILMGVVAIFGTEVVISLVTTSNNKDVAEEAAVGVLTVEVAILLTLGLAFYIYMVVLSFYKEFSGEIPQ